MISVIVPAHNEEAVIHRCLSALKTAEINSQQLELIVVCNGCSDKTAEIASGFPLVRVIETDIASKVNALNLGDQAAKGFPRVYLDADVVLDLADMLETISVLESNASLLAVAPAPNFDLSRANFWVKCFYRIWLKLPYFSAKHMIGSGVYILSRAGRDRFQEFPNLISDDGYVRSLFSDEERLTVKNVSFTVFAPGNLGSLIKIKSRARFGNMEVVYKYPEAKLGGENTPAAFLKVVLQQPWLAPSAIVYAYVQWRTKVNSKKRFAQQDFSTWERDDSAR